jgi:hypothetical protein
MLTLRCRQADFVVIVSSWVLLLTSIIVAIVVATSNKLIASAHGRNENLEQGFITGVNETCDILSPVTMTPVIIYHWCR